LKKGLLPWNPNLLSEVEELKQKIEGVDNPLRLQQEIFKESLERLTKVVGGLNKYMASDVNEYQTEHKVIWEEGTTKLLDYGKGDKGAILFVPSLINRSYIFDISAKRSMVKYLSKAGLHTFLLDWDKPSDVEKDFSISDYIKRLEIAIEKAAKKSGGKVTLAGYCMGGLMALAAAISKKDLVGGLVLLATPWDFNSRDTAKIPMNEDMKKFLSAMFETGETVSGQLVYQLLYLSKPWTIHNKYIRFASMDGESEDAKSFIEREKWLHDGVDLTKKVAKECFIDWAVDNVTEKGKWEVDGKVINPSEVACPTMVVIPQFDRIVPRECATALGMKIKNAQTVFPSCGHIGMVAGTNAKEHLWLSLEKWVSSL